MKTWKMLLLAALAAGGFATGASAQKLVILHLNDTHSHFEPVRSGAEAGLGGIIERAAYVDSVRQAMGRRNVLLLHAGDFSQGTPYFTQFNGDMEVEMINALGYDAVILGNHEFDNGLEELARRVRNIRCPVLCSNYDFSQFELGKYVRPYVILRRGGYKIGIFSLLTDVSTAVDRSVSSKMTKLDDAEVANKWAKYLKEDCRCDLVIALNHIGYELESYTDPEMVAETRNIDLVIGGHSHTFLEEMKYAPNLDGKQVPIVQDGCWGLYFGKIDVY